MMSHALTPELPGELGARRPPTAPTRGAAAGWRGGELSTPGPRAVPGSEA